jgi:hypothetical protein
VGAFIAPSSRKTGYQKLTGSLGVQIVEPPVFFITVAQSRRFPAPKETKYRST